MPACWFFKTSASPDGKPSIAAISGVASHSHHPLSCCATAITVAARSRSGSGAFAKEPGRTKSSFPQCAARYPATSAWSGCATNHILPCCTVLNMSTSALSRPRSVLVPPAVSRLTAALRPNPMIHSHDANWRGSEIVHGLDYPQPRPRRAADRCELRGPGGRPPTRFGRCSAIRATECYTRLPHQETPIPSAVLRGSIQTSRIG